MDKIQIGPWSVSRQDQLKVLWIATVTEMATGSIPSPSMMGRYLKSLPPLRECLLSVDSLSASSLGSTDFRTLWGLKLQTPLIINTYRAFLKRILLPVDESDIVNQFSMRTLATLDDRQRALLRGLLPYCPSLFGPPWDWSNRCAFGPGVVSEQSGLILPYWKVKLLAQQIVDEESSRTSRIILVPKDWKKKRLIAAEPIGLGYAQHGLASVLMQTIEDCSPIRFSDQGQNRRRCNMQHATIDLSDASDTVLLDHVSLLLPQWYDALCQVRSTHGKYRDCLYTLNMYGTMGSACTFPVETWVFYSISYGIMNYLGATYEELQDLRVYGDDIVTPLAWGQIVSDFLTETGFKVNYGKSFWGSSDGYRETCGVETFFDSDVTPIRLPRGATEKWLENVDPQSFCDFITRLTSYGCFQLARVLLSSWGDWGVFRPQWLKSSCLGSYPDRDEPKPYSAWLLTGEQLESNISQTVKCSFNKEFSQDQWDVFARDYYLAASGDMRFQASYYPTHLAKESLLAYAKEADHLQLNGDPSFVKRKLRVKK